MEKTTGKCVKIGVTFENAKNKIEYYNNLPKAKICNQAYKKLLNTRKGSSSLVNADGDISEKSLNRFNQMGHAFCEGLSKKLQKGEIREILKSLRDLRIESEEWKEHRDEIEKLYKELSTEGESSLHTGKKRFDVGAKR